MFRFLARVVGLVLIAGGFVGLVIDGTKSLANSSVTFTSLEELATSTFPRGFAQLGPAVSTHLHPWLWDPVLIKFFLLPAAVVAFVIGGALLWLGQKPAEPIGYRAEG